MASIEQRFSPGRHESYEYGAGLATAERILDWQKYVTTRRFHELPLGAQREGYKMLAAGMNVLTKFLIEKSMAGEGLEPFWRKFQSTADKRKMGKDAGITRRGLVGQIGMHHMLERMGLNPHIASPEEDVIWDMDFRIEPPVDTSEHEEPVVGVQVKYARSDQEPMIVEVSDELSPQDIRVEKGTTDWFFRGRHLSRLMRMRAKLAEYEKLTGHKAYGFYVTLPGNCIDQNTGRPQEPCIKLFREKLLAAPHGEEFLWRHPMT